MEVISVARPNIQWKGYTKLIGGYAHTAYLIGYWVYGSRFLWGVENVVNRSLNLKFVESKWAIWDIC